MSLLRTRLERAAQLLASGEWREFSARLVRKVTPKGDPPEAMQDPEAYARWLARNERRFRRERQKAEGAGADVRTVIVGDGPLRFEPQAGSATLFVRAWDSLEPGAERLFAAAFARGADVVTCDDDRIDGAGRRVRPRFKPAWSPERLLEDPYVLPAFLVRDTLLEGFAPPAGTADEVLYAIALHVRERVRRSEHLPLPLAHIRDMGPDPVSPLRARFVAPPDARVSIMIPFRDRPELLARCLESLFAHTAPHEVLLLDNGSVEAATAALLRKWQARVRVLPLPGPFNFAALNNKGAELATGTHLLLLNNDTEILARGWLEELMAIASQPHVGAVGCKLLYPDRTLQHAGVWLGVAGLAAHAYLGLAEDYPGHEGEARVLRNVSAVTGACLMVEKTKWAAASGMNARDFRVAFNDLDLCLRLEERGWRTVYTPHVTLVHHESKSRGSRVEMDEERAFMRRWRKRIEHDPYVSENLSRLVADGRWR